MSISQADLDALDRMIVSGVLMSVYDGKKIEYRTMRELREARAVAARQIASANGLSVAPGYTPIYSKGV